MTQTEKFGDRIKKMRLELGLTQEDLAKRTGYTSRSSINKIELGLVNLPQDKIVRIANALSTTPAYLMGWEEDTISKATIDQALIATYGGDVTPEQLEKIKDYIAYVMEKKK